MKDRHILIKMAIFLSILVMPTVLWGIFSLTGIKDKLDFDLEEKREKHTISSDVRLSELPGEIEAYYNDRVPFRSILIDTNNKINTKLEKNYADKIEPIFLGWINKNKDNEPEQKPSYVVEETTPANTQEPSGEDNPTSHTHDFTLVEKKDSDYENYGYELYRCSGCSEEKRQVLEKLIDTSIYPMKIVGNTTIIGRYNWLFYEKTLADYRGENLIANEAYAGHVDIFVKLKNKCDELGKELYFIVLPNKNSVYPEYMPTVDRVAKKRRVEGLKEYIDNNTDLVFQYPLKEMYANKPYRQLYYRYDTHWNENGFLVGVNSLYSAMGMKTITYDDYEIITQNRDSGDLAILAGIDISAYQPDTCGTIIYKPEIESQSNRIYEDRYVETNSTSQNQKKLFLMGDSYRFGFEWFLSKDF